MSFYYSKVPETKKVAKVYGYKKVEKKDLEDITERLSRQTKSFKDIDTSRQIRTPSARSRRSASASGVERKKVSRKLTEKDLNRMIRRLRKPTISSRVNDINFDINDFAFIGALTTDDIPNRPRTAEDRDKSLNDLCRPTTASSCKSFDRYKYAGEGYNKYDNEYVYSSSAPPDEIDQLVDRVNRTTISRANGSIRCSKALLRVESEMEITKSMALPLLSGLPRSRTTHEIVNRLYTRNRTISSSAY